MKLWQLPEGISRFIHLTCSAGAVLALTVRGDTVYAGCQDGLVKVWDLKTHTLVRTLLVVEVGRSSQADYSCTDIASV